VSRAQVSLTRLVEIAEAFCAQHPPPRGRGRPATYSEALVLALWAFKQLHGLTWRQLESVSRQVLPQAPDFSTLHYRVRRIPQERWAGFQRLLAGQVPEGTRL
jgi:hypothetical protein